LCFMWGALRRLFRKEQPGLKVENLEKWFEGKFSAEEENLKQLAEGWRKRIKELIQLCHESLNSLREAELLNPNIPIKEKQYMEGNRKSYVQRTRIFLGEVNENLAFQPELFFTYYARSLEEFTKATIRPYQILQNFFASEVQEAAMHVKEIDKAVAGYRNDPAIRRFSRMQLIRKKFSLLDNKRKKKEELKAELSKIEEENSMLAKKAETVENEKEQMSGSQLNTILTERKEKMQECMQKRKELEDNLTDVFSPLSRAFRKLEKISLQHAKLIEHYAADPLNALMTDHTLALVEILERVLKNLPSFSLKNEDKIRDSVSTLNRDFLTHFVSAYKELKEGEKTISSEISKLEEQMGISSMEETLGDISSRMQGLQAKKEHLLKEQSSLDIRTFRQGIKREIEEAMAVKLEESAQGF